MTVVATFGGSEGTTFWPAAGVTVAVLVWRPRREWGWLLAGVWTAEFFLNFVVSNIPFGVSVGWAFANCLEPLLAALLLTRGGRGAPDLGERDDLLRFVAFGVIAGPALGALVGVGSGRIGGFYAMFPALPRWFVGDAVGALVLAPMVLTILQRRVVPIRAPRAVAGHALALAGATALVVAPWGVSWDPVLPFLIVPALAFTALRTGPPGAAFGLAAVGLVVNAMTAAGYGPFALEDQILGLIEAQAFLAMSAFAGLVVAALTRDLITRREAEEIRTTFVHTLAHDLRGPLGVIRGFVELLLDHEDELDRQQRRHALQRIDNTADRLLRLVGDVLDLDRLDTPGGSRAPVDLRARLSALVGSLGSGERPIDVASEPLIIRADPVGIERIVENLVANAVRHTPPGTPIHVRAWADGDGVVLAVDDEGPGVSDEDKERIFAPFHRGSDTASGTGLGLALVTRMAQMHDGRAWVEDRIGGGASFRVFLACPPEKAGEPEVAGTG